MNTSPLIVFIALAAVLANTSVSALDITIVADNQEKELFGHNTGFSAKEAQDETKVALRSSEQELFSKYVLRAALQDMPTAALAIHLGDLLDYSCATEWKRVASSLFSAPEGVPVLMAPGNHDGLFQGNVHYGAAVRNVLLFRSFWEPKAGIDPGLEGHANAVCDPEWGGVRRYQAKFRKRDLVCAYLLRNPALAGDAAALRATCEGVERGRTAKISLAEAARLRFSHDRAQPDVHGRALHVSFYDDRATEWSRGHLLQIQRLPLDETRTRFVSVILLDTADWQTAPHFVLADRLWPCRSANNTDCGFIGNAQRLAVDAYLDGPGREDFIVLAGHYPLHRGAMHADTREWLKARLARPNVLSRFVSAHTHDAFSDDSNANVDSLADHPVSYRVLSLRLDGDQVRAHLAERDLGQTLRCDEVLELERDAVIKSVAAFVGNAHTGNGYGREQWLHRARDAERAMREMAAHISPGQALCAMADGPLSHRSDRAKIAARLTSCQAALDELIEADPEHQKRAACHAIVGAKALHALYPDWPMAKGPRPLPAWDLDPAAETRTKN
ncbi:MAG TPA: metallophosphoesterase family protein [Solimonas sp.]